MKYFYSMISFLAPAISLAQDVGSKAASNSKGPGMESLLVQLGIIFVIFYFLLIRPQSKKMKAHQELISSLKKGDKIVTSGGVFGTVSKAKDGDKTVEIEVAKDVEITVLRSSIQEILNLTVEKKSDNGKKIKKANDNNPEKKQG